MRRNRAVPFCLFFFGGLTVPVTRGWGRQIEHTEKSRTLRARRGELGQKGNRPLRHRSPTHFPSVFTLIAVKRKDWKGRRQPKRERERERERKNERHYYRRTGVPGKCLIAVASLSEKTKIQVSRIERSQSRRRRKSAAAAA